MRNEVQIEVLLHKSSGTAMVRTVDYSDREYLLLRATAERELCYHVFDDDPLRDFDSGPRVQAVAARHSKDKGSRLHRIGRKPRTFRDMN